MIFKIILIGRNGVGFSYFSNIFIYSQSIIFINYQVDVKQFPNPMKYIKMYEAYSCLQGTLERKLTIK